MQIPKERFALTLCALLSCCAPLLLEAAPLSPPQTAAATTILGLSERPVYYKRFVRRRPSPHDKVLDVYEVREVYYVRRTTVKPPRQLSNEEIDRRILCDFNPTVPECAETLRGATTSSTTEPSTTTTTTTTTAATTTKATTTKATTTKATTTKATTTTEDLPFLPILPESTTEDDYMLPEEDDEEDLDDTVDGIKPYTNYDNDERTEYEAPEEQQEDQEDEEEEEQEVEKKQEEDENDYMDHINHGSIGGLDMS